MKYVLALMIVFMLVSCTVTKRRYNKGFYIDWFSGSGKQKSQTFVQSDARKDSCDFTSIPFKPVSSGNLVHGHVIDSSLIPLELKSTLSHPEVGLTSIFTYPTVAHPDLDTIPDTSITVNKANRLKVLAGLSLIGSLSTIPLFFVSIYAAWIVSLIVLILSAFIFFKARKTRNELALGLSSISVTVGLIAVVVPIIILLIIGIFLFLFFRIY